MAGRFSTYSANLILSKVLRGVDFTPTTSYWVALFMSIDDTALRANSPSTAVEVGAGLGYARIEVRGATGLIFGVPSLGASSLSSALTWPSATSGWGTLTYAALMDSATMGAGNVIVYGGLTIPKVVDIGDIFKIDTGLFTIAL